MAKTVVIIPDGLPDRPQDDLSGRTPLAVAATPVLDQLAQEGKLGRVRLLPEDGPTDSSVALMTILGYDGSTITGRGYYEALDAGLTLPEGTWACRCQFVTTDGKAVIDPSAGNLSTAEARELIKLINEQVGIDGVSFHFSSRNDHIATLADEAGLDPFVPSPWEVRDKPFDDYLSTDATRKVREVMNRCHEVLDCAEVNVVRRDLGESPANLAFLWGAGRGVKHETLRERSGLTCAMVSFSTMARGIARAVGADNTEAPDASPEPREELRHLAQSALHALSNHDLAFVHVGFPDNYARTRDCRGKVRAVELIDEYLVKPLAVELRKRRKADEEGGDVRLAIVPTLVSDITTRRHHTDPVPFLIWGNDVKPDDAKAYSEEAAQDTGLFVEDGKTLLAHLLEVK